MNQTLSIHPEMQSLVRIAETGARAALKLGQDLQPMLIGPGKSGPVIVAIHAEKDDVPAALRRAVSEFNLERFVFVREARITAEAAWCLLVTLFDGRAWSYLAAGIQDLPGGLREAGRLQPVPLAFDPVRDGMARVQA